MNRDTQMVPDKGTIHLYANGVELPASPQLASVPGGYEIDYSVVTLPSGHNLMKLVFQAAPNNQVSYEWSYKAVAPTFGSYLGHYYGVVVAPGISWQDANTIARMSQWRGQPGHLATITSAGLDLYLETLRQICVQNGGFPVPPPGSTDSGHTEYWVGGVQNPDQTIATADWSWINNESPFPGINGGLEVYTNWQPNEPNDSGGPGYEQFLAIGNYNQFGWNDEGHLENILGYVVEYQDTLSPVVSKVFASPAVLTPANHKMVPVILTVTATDNWEISSTKIISVTSNEPENGLGDGDTASDWQITGDLAVNLRAERAGSAIGRVYTITVECSDAAGNATRQSTTVTVPHDKRK